MIDRYISIIKSLLDSGVEYKNISQTESFINFRKDNPICFGDAFQIDNFFNKGGSRWITAYGFPYENDIIKIDTSEFKAVNVGVFTFSLEEVNKDQPYRKRKREF